MHVPQHQVAAFHEACDLPRPKEPYFDWNDCEGVRTDLILEEANEFKDAVKDRDIPGMIDALCDLLYVTYGAAVSMGIDLEPFYNHVHQCNMKKVGGPRREDGKQLKPADWTPPDHMKILAENYPGLADRLMSDGPK